jgi:hypothetical protein
MLLGIGLLIFWALVVWRIYRLTKCINAQHVIINDLITKVVQQKCVIMDLYQSDARFTTQLKPNKLSLTVKKALKKKGEGNE